MNVKELRKLLENEPDDAVILCPASDHNYRIANVSLDTALKDKDGNWTEDYGEEATPQKVYGKRLKVLIVE